MKHLLGGKGANLGEMACAWAGTRLRSREAAPHAPPSAALGLPVPAGFTISTETCKFFAEHGDMPPGLDAQVRGRALVSCGAAAPLTPRTALRPPRRRQIDEGIRSLESTMNAKFGDNCTEEDTPLLVSVRSGAATSMPGAWAPPPGGARVLSHLPRLPHGCAPR